MLGYPGAGKTTAAKVICELTGAVHLWADLERKNIFERPNFGPRETKKLYPVLDEKLKQLLNQGQSVVYDSNFNFYKDRRRMERLAESYGADAVVIWVQTPKEQARQRATDAHRQHTRILDAMPLEHFERMSGNLQPPHDNETVITVNGTLNPEKQIRKALQL